MPERARLRQLRLRDLGVIEEATLELGPGLTVLTGETGAGKTMVVTALGLLLGARSDSGAVRPGARSAVVEGIVAPVTGAGPWLAARVDEAGGAIEDDELILVRSVSQAGRSRAVVGGTAVPVSLLAELGGALVAVHGQSDQQRLLSPAAQREALDRFAGADDATSEFAGLLVAWRRDLARLREVDATLHEIATRGRERAQELDLLRFGLEEIERVGPRPGEDAELREEESRLAHAETLREAAHSAHGRLAGDDDTAAAGADASSLVADAARRLQQAAEHDPGLADLSRRAGELSYLLADLAADLASYASAIEVDPARLSAVSERRAALTALTRKYGPELPDVLAWSQRAARRVLELDGDDERRDGLVRERQELHRRLETVGRQLHDHRAESAARLSEAVTGELSALAMPHARLEVAVTLRREPDGSLQLGSGGADEVELRLQPHPGAPARGISRGASGGELSRVMLALEVVLAAADPVPVFVFDEVDAGVGGKAAIEIGRRLARLARHAQVLCVTHLPQVAAFADQHLVVVKSDDGSVTRSGVTPLDTDGRVVELARMLAGLEGSDTALAHARELLETARREAAATFANQRISKQRKAKAVVAE
ncbi:MAG: DNA repair protein RecN [Actinomycetes bacterium]